MNFFRPASFFVLCALSTLLFGCPRADPNSVGMEPGIVVVPGSNDAGTNQGLIPVQDPADSAGADSGEPGGGGMTGDTTQPQACETDSDCSDGALCDISTGECLECVEDGDCTAQG